MKQDPRIVYAQSSDIKSRTYLEYRRDMKRKAIAELEVVDWLQAILQQQHPGKQVVVSKSGGDRFLWFLRGGGVTREPDFVAQINGQQQQIEFQYAEAERLDFYDFKVSKVTTRKGPKKDVCFLYIHKPKAAYALLDADWIVQNGKLDEVPAWRTQAYRVPAEHFEKQLREDCKLRNKIKVIDAKNRILEFQHRLLEEVREQLAQRIVQAVEQHQPFSIMPDDLEGFFHACFIMDALQKAPEPLDAWLHRAIELAESVDSLKATFQAVYCLDSLYFRIPTKEPFQELSRFIKVLKSIKRKVKGWYSATDGAYCSDANADRCLETRYALFIINSLEDMIQDILHYRKETLEERKVALEPIKKIYQNLRAPFKTAKFIQQCGR
ncbi:hypothetical protein HRbin15_00870 [bacterium HR15]|nr:hypothetical protein HRbin15_00870 [bacterium HR15]